MFIRDQTLKDVLTCVDRTLRAAEQFQHRYPTYKMPPKERELILRLYHLRPHLHSAIKHEPLSRAKAKAERELKKPTGE